MKTASVKNRYFDKTNIENLHQECRTWLSSFEFWKGELKFMHNLINKNFVFFVAKDQHHSLQALLEKITKVEQVDLVAIKEKVVNYEHLLSDYMKGGYKPEFETLLIKQVNLCNEVGKFQNNYRLMKTELFRMAEEVVKEKNIKKIANFSKV